MNDGGCWMTKNDLDLMKNLNNVEQFKGYVDDLRENEIFVWRHLLLSGELEIDTHKVHIFCANVRSKYKNVVCGLKPTSTVVVFRPFHDFLERIQFPFRG